MAFSMVLVLALNDKYDGNASRAARQSIFRRCIRRIAKLCATLLNRLRCNVEPLERCTALMAINPRHYFGPYAALFCCLLLVGHSTPQMGYI